MPGRIYAGGNSSFSPSVNLVFFGVNGGLFGIIIAQKAGTHPSLQAAESDSQLFKI